MSIMIEKALSLPYDEQTILLERLAESLEHRDDPPPVSEAWKMEIRRRVEEIKSGKAKLVDGPEGFARVRKSLEK